MPCPHLTPLPVSLRAHTAPAQVSQNPPPSKSRGVPRAFWGAEPGTPNVGASGGGHQPWGWGTTGSWSRLPCSPHCICWAPRGGSQPCQWPPCPSPAPGGLSRGHRVRQLVLEPGRKAGCWETSLLSSDKNSSVFKARGRAALLAALWDALAPTEAAGDGTGWPDPAGSVPRTPPSPTPLSGHGAGGRWCVGLGGALALPSAAPLCPQIGLENV